MAMTLDSLCKWCSLPIRDHALDREGAWFVQPCTPRLLSQKFADGSTVAEHWARMCLEDGLTCKWCCQPLAGHFQLGFPTIGIATDDSLEVKATVSMPDPKPGGIMIPLVCGWCECRTQEQFDWRPPPPPTAHEDGSPFGLRNPWATGSSDPQ